MKSKLILALVTLGCTTFGLLPEAHAGGSHRRHHHHHDDEYSYRESRSCQPYRVSTCEVDRCTHHRVRYDHCGHAYGYCETTVTYRDHYSDGSCRTYTRTYRS